MATGKNVKRNKNLKAVFNFSHRESYHDYMGRRMREENAKEKMLNSPINTIQQLMCITMEECGELTQRLQ